MPFCIGVRVYGPESQLRILCFQHFDNFSKSGLFMKTNKMSLVGGILSGDKTQRLRGLVLEIFFQKTISPYVMELTRAKDCSFGWLKGWVQNKQCFVKFLVSGEISTVDEVFSQEMRIQGACVVFLRPVIHLADLQGYVCDTTSCSPAEAAIGTYIANSATSFLSKFVMNSNASSTLSCFFSVLSEEELICTFSSRIIMNSNCMLGVTDLDAIYLAADSRLVVVEFKRKYPAVKYRQLKKLPISDVDVGALLAALRSNTSSVFDVGYITSSCFGLDLSHVKNYIFFSGASIEYVYMIFESSQKDPSKLFDVSFKGFEETKIVFKRLNASDFVGVCETSGNHLESDGELRAQSGSWNNGLRYQLAILQSSFSQNFTI
jgi:hypothetical protein